MVSLLVAPVSLEDRKVLLAALDVRVLTERVDRVGLELIELLGAQPGLARHREGLRVRARAALADRALPQVLGEEEARRRLEALEG